MRFTGRAEICPSQLFNKEVNLSRLLKSRRSLQKAVGIEPAFTIIACSLSVNTATLESAVVI